MKTYNIIELERKGMILKSLYTKIFRLAENVQFKKQMKFKTPSHIQEKLDIVYGKDEQSNRFDIYYPKNLEGQKLPTILNIHGGGYIAGKKENSAEYCRKLANKGYCVINMEYTLADKEGFPKPVYDAFDLFDYISKDEEIMSHVDYNNFFIAGDSAGGHIASSIANIQCNEDVKKEFNVSGGPKIKGLILNSPVFGVFRFGNFPILKKTFEKLVFGKYRGSKIQQYCHNFDILNKNFPPTITFSADNDFIRIHNSMFCKKAEALGLDVQSYNFVSGKHLSHDFIIFNTDGKEGQFALDKIDNFINDTMGNRLKKGVYKTKVNLSKKVKKEKKKECL